MKDSVLKSVTGLASQIRSQISSKIKLNSTDQSKNKNIQDTQSVVNVKSIKNGIICGRDGSYTKILEVLSLNYYQKNTLEKNKITESFMQLFKTCPQNLHIKTRTEKEDTFEIIRTVRENCKREDNPMLMKRAEDYIKHITMLKDMGTVTIKFYIIFGYEGENGNYSRDFRDIYESLRRREIDIRSKLKNTGNIVITPKNPDYHACEVWYKYFNPISCASECLQDRIDRVCADYNKIGKGNPTEADFIATRGITSKPTTDWLLMDGMYHTWLVIIDNAYPGITQTGWLDNIPCSLGIDKDIFIKRYSKNTVDAALSQIKKFKYSSYNSSSNPDKSLSLMRDINNAEYIKRALKQDEDLFGVEIIITIRAETYSKMKDMKQSVQDCLDGFSIYTATSFMTAMEYMKCTAPDMYNNRAFFSKYSHNFLTRNVAQLYPFTSISLFNNEGFVIGENVQGGSLVALNNYDTHLYSNANIVVMGTPGAGKTYLLLMLGYRMRLMAIRVIYIIPLKAHEYYLPCKMMGGLFISLVPGGKVCINIMEIRPQYTKNGDLIDDRDGAKGMKASLLARKISSLCTWLQLNMRDDRLSTSEKNRFNVLCKKLYANFGITENNDSIWLDKEKRILRTMPILQDLNDAIQEDPVLSRIKDVLSPFMYGGLFANFNGYTNVDLNNEYIVFDVDKNAIGEDYLPSIMYIAVDCGYDIAKQDLMQKVSIYLDELWYMLQDPDCVKQVIEMVKIIRGYGSNTVIATQDIEDFLRSKNGAGKAILTSSKIKFLLKCDDMELNSIAETINITANDRANFNKFPPNGRALMISDTDKMLIDLIASEEEDKLFTTDINLRKKYAQEEANA